MFVPESGKDLHLCSCGCNREVSRSTVWRHKKKPPPPIEQLEPPPPPKRSRIAHFQAGHESFVVKPGKQKQSRTDDNSSTAHPRADASSSSNHPQSSIPQLHAPLFESNPSPLGSPQASNIPQSPGDARTEASGLFVDDVLLDLHARTHRTADQSHDEDYGDTLEGDADEVADPVDHETDDFWNGEDVAMGDVDPREGIVSDRDLLAEEFIVEAEELGKFEHSLLHTL